MRRVVLAAWFLVFVSACERGSSAGRAAGALERQSHGVAARSTDRAAAAKVRGIVLSTHTNGSDWAAPDIGATMADLRAVGATWVSIHPYARIDGDGNVGFRPIDPAAPPPHLARPIAAAHEAGLEIAITPHLAYWGSPFHWAGDIEFHDDASWERFFTAYTQWVVTLAQACPQANGFILGTELDRTLGHEESWRELIRQVRAVTKAPLSYGANWSDYQRVPFWDALDAIGIQAYFPLADSTGASAKEIEKAWEKRMRTLRAFAAQHNRRIVFTELGYNRAFAAPVRPWDAHVDGEEAEAVQEACLRVALAAVEREPSVAGVFLWKWFPNPRPVGRNFQLATPRLKQTIAAVWLP
jgi:glycosyl hydrolase family 113